MPGMPPTTYGPDLGDRQTPAAPGSPSPSGSDTADGREPSACSHAGAVASLGGAQLGGARVDAPRDRSVSFPPIDGIGRERDARPVPSGSGGLEGHELVAVGPGVPGPVLPGVPAGMMGPNPLPVTGARIHRPLLRDDVLSRERLNGWLDRAATGRLVLVIAEAGFGKTTLLADWSRNTSRLTAWYRLEPDDRDWLTFIRHLMASGRELDPGFAEDAYRMLLRLGPGGPTRPELVASLVREMSEFGAAKPGGVTLIFDDYHAVDGSEETDPIVRAILEQTGPGFSVVIASRSNPRLPLGRLRARGAVARLDGDALFFDVAEADRLFRDAYHQPMDPDVIAELVRRTEGWAALLSLVRTNLEESKGQDPRELVRHLSGGRGDLYDYLAEEVLDRLPEELSRFLTRVALLDEVDPEAAGVLAGSDDQVVARLIAAAEELGLLSRPDVGSSPRFLPMVRDFLTARLAAEAGAAGIREMHLAIAGHFRGRRWRLAATHYDRAGSAEEAALVIEMSLDEILGRGEYRAAMDLFGTPSREGPVYHVLRSRLLLQVGDGPAAVAAAREAVSSAESGAQTHLHLALLNAASVSTAVRQHEDAQNFASRAEEVTSDETERELAEGYKTIPAASTSSSLPALALQLERLLAAQQRREQWHYAAITSLNLAQLYVWLDRSAEAVKLATESDRLFRRSSGGYELVSVSLVMAQANALVGKWSESERLLGIALRTSHPEGKLEAVLEAAAIAAWYGPPGLAAEFLARTHRVRLAASWALHWRVLDLWLEDDEARRLDILASIPDAPPPSTEVGAAFRWHLTVARTHLRDGRVVAFSEAIRRAAAVAASQHSPLQSRLVSLLDAIGHEDDALSWLLRRWPAADDATLGVFAEEICSRLGSVAEDAVVTLARAGMSQPHRWREPLRKVLAGPDIASATTAASLLDLVGEPRDIALLRRFSKRAKQKGQTWGDELVRRVAPRVAVEDLGLMSVTIGNRKIDGRAIRRKVLAMIGFLAAQGGGSATPDQILDALWPDLDPEQGANSIHQTIYFMRRVLDPNYQTGVTPEYLHFDAEVVWLDTTLVDYRSWQCRRLLQAHPRDRKAVEAILDLYRGRFAADFEYEDWATPYRETLHAQFLGLMERAVAGDIGSSDPTWRLSVGQRVLRVDPGADAIEAAVIRLYRLIGAPAAAAEQYAHYASVLRDDLGVEPPPIEDV